MFDVCSLFGGSLHNIIEIIITMKMCVLILIILCKMLPNKLKIKLDISKKIKRFLKMAKN